MEALFTSLLVTDLPIMQDNYDALVSNTNGSTSNFLWAFTGKKSSHCFLISISNHQNIRIHESTSWPSQKSTLTQTIPYTYLLSPGPVASLKVNFLTWSSLTPTGWSLGILSSRKTFPSTKLQLWTSPWIRPWFLLHPSYTHPEKYFHPYVHVRHPKTHPSPPPHWSPC